MRLRRETGDFSLSFAHNVTSKTIAKGLGAEDLIGVIVEYNGNFYVVTGASESEGTIALDTGLAGYNIAYVVATGVITLSAVSSGSNGANS